jgi:hypothetical protein
MMGKLDWWFWPAIFLIGAGSFFFHIIFKVTA